LSNLYGKTQCAPHTPSLRICRRRQRSVFPRAILSLRHARSIAAAAAALRHAALQIADYSGVFILENSSRKYTFSRAPTRSAPLARRQSLINLNTRGAVRPVALGKVAEVSAPSARRRRRSRARVVTACIFCAELTNNELKNGRVKKCLVHIFGRKSPTKITVLRGRDSQYQPSPLIGVFSLR